MKHIVDTGRLPDGLDLLSFCDGLVFFAPVALLVRTTAGVSAGQFFLLQALIAAAALLGELPCGRLTDRIGYRSTIRLCEGCFFLARALLMAAFLARSLPLFVLEAAVEGLAISLESGTWDAYLYGVLPPERYLPKKARMENWCTAGFLCSTLGYGVLYAAGGLPALLGATVCTSGAAFALSFALPRGSRPAPRREAPRPGQVRVSSPLCAAAPCIPREIRRSPRVGMHLCYTDMRKWYFVGRRLCGMLWAAGT